jgi:hypothetical protein
MIGVKLLPGLLVLSMLGLPCAAAPGQELAPGVRGLATRAPDKVVIDGDLSEFKDAFCTPINYFHPDANNRAAQFFYMWDEQAFYAGLRTLDQKRANLAPDDRLWEGDGVEWYFDTRRGEKFRSKEWTNDGSVHCYWVGLTGTEIKSRFCLRPGYLDAIPKIGIEVASRETPQGLEVEFKMPWKNLPNFKPATGEVIAVDAELCYSDGGPRVDRYFAYGSPLSVQQPASLAKVQLVERMERDYWKACGPVMMPIRCDTPWSQPTKAHAEGRIALPPNLRDQVGKIVFHLTDLAGETLGDYEAKVADSFAKGSFAMAVATWPADNAPPGGHHVTAIVYDRDGKELTRIAPRWVSTSMRQGY